MKRLLHSVPLLSAILLVGLVVAAATPRPVAASPLHYFAVAAQGCTLPSGGAGTLLSDKHTCCPFNSYDATSCIFEKYINPLIALLAAIVGVVIVIAIIYGGIEYVTSGGDPQRSASGKKHIVNALFGLAAFVLLYTFLQFIIPGGVLHG